MSALLHSRRPVFLQHFVTHLCLLRSHSITERCHGLGS
jgi:hypothetical protein